MPDHPFELLDALRFQEFCQALLTLEFPKLQCLPVAQPDGGRDALVRDSEDNTLVFQVKFSRAPQNLTDPTNWIKRILAIEADKLERLVDRGATEYKLITNLSATAHLDSGSLDKVQKELSKLPIPAECWWREDLNRRLEGAFDIKLSYPELFTGNDFIRILVDRNGPSPDAIRRQRAITSYIAEQYDGDRDVRFKQADLVNDLFKFFIDVPAIPALTHTQESELARTVKEFRRGGDEFPVGKARAGREDALLVYGASTLLLHGAFQQISRRVIVDGAPGQGKSTMLQYICQTHRLRILEKKPGPEVPRFHLNGPLRLPFKIELRDFAQWRDRQQSDDGLEQKEAASLERFLAHSIEVTSGGVLFDVADLQAVVGESSVLLALDGLDEIADSDDRQQVTLAIESAVRRLEAIAASFQVVVTSRPSSFAGASHFSNTAFASMRLQSVDRELIEVYAEKWMDARRLNRRSRLEVIKPLREKLDEPHVREIAQNPMQLAILLDLVNRRGEAFPDQRNALYRDYMDMFLDREAGKSEAVRKHRKLLMALHGYLAWVLHSRTEKSSAGAGRFAGEEVKAIVGDFLESKGHPRDLFGDLFAGVFDRVGALVSRVQGTYEFEIQPLREYFAAHYLYQTASYSTAGDTRTGTRPERFDAIARRPYWLNVARFYAGSYDSGELASLADRLSDLYRDPVWSMTPHPRAVTARLLADWTFEQERHIQDGVTDLLAHHLATRGGPTESDTEHPPQLMALPVDCGGPRLADAAWAALRTEPRGDRRAALARFVVAQVPDAAARRERWAAELQSLRGEDRNRWCESARDLKVGESLGAERLNLPQEVSEEALAALLRGGQFGACDRDRQITERALQSVLRSPQIALPRALDSRHPLPMLAELLALDATLPELRKRSALAAMAEVAETSPPGYRAAAEFIAYMARAIPDGGGSWSKLDPWDRAIEEGRRLLGDCPALTDLAVAITGRTSSIRGGIYPDLLDPSASLCTRTRQARLRSGNRKWWQEQLRGADSDDQRVMVIALAWCWASEEILSQIAADLTIAQAALSDASRGRLVRLVPRCLLWIPEDRLHPIRRTRWLAEVDALTFCCASRRMALQVALGLYLRAGPFDEETDRSMLEILAPYEFAAAKSNPDGWRNIARTMQRRMAAGAWVPARMGPVDEAPDAQGMTAGLATSVVTHADDYPLLLVAQAENRCMTELESNLESVAEVAVRDSWFSP